MNQKIINQHYYNEAKKYLFSAKSTMPDLLIRKLEIVKLEEVIGKLLNQNKVERILEVGCGNGYTLSQISRKFKLKFVGIDTNPAMINLAKKRKLKNVEFRVCNILKTNLDSASVDLVFSERCLINIMSWKNQIKALQNIHKVLHKNGHYIMLESFEDGLNNLNKARKSLGLDNIPPAWHNYYFKKKRFETFIKQKFIDYFTRNNKITYDNFLSTYYFGSRIIYPSLINGKKQIIYNNKFVEYFTYGQSFGNYSPIQLCTLEKI